MFKIGFDLGSTTIKTVVLNECVDLIFKDYRRHNAQIGECMFRILKDIEKEFMGRTVSVAITGSVGMGLSAKSGIDFVQEVVAVTKALKHSSQLPRTMIDIGGEDAKVVFFDSEGKAEELRMNGNCSGGTGAFIDHMAVILGEELSSLDILARRAGKIHPIAARCGVFCKTDIQNLVAKGAKKEDIAASIFHAVVIQTIVTLAHGREIVPPVLFCGGPLSFIPALRESFKRYLKLQDKDIIIPDNSTLLPAEIASYYSLGVKNVVSLQPFGCIANHIIVKGVENKIKKLYPDINLLSLDFDSGVSEVNIQNRLLLFTSNLKK